MILSHRKGLYNQVILYNVLPYVQQKKNKMNQDKNKQEVLVKPLLKLVSILICLPPIRTTRPAFLICESPGKQEANLYLYDVPFCI